MWMSRGRRSISVGMNTALRLSGFVPRLGFLNCDASVESPLKVPFIALGFSLIPGLVSGPDLRLGKEVQPYAPAQH